MEFKKKNDKDLLKLFAEKRKALREFRFNVSGQGNVREGRHLRKDIARILTEIRARELRATTN